MKHILGRVQITRKCNQECVFCSAPPDEEELSIDGIRKKIDQLQERGTTDIMLTGGEPLLHPDILGIVDYCWNKGFPEITIQTNGTMIREKRIAQVMHRYRDRLKFNVSFHSSDRERSARISRKEGNLDRMIAGLKDLESAGFVAYFTIVINSHNLEGLVGLVRFIRENFSFRHCCFNYIDPVYKAREDSSIIPRFSYAEKFVRDAVLFMKANGMTFRIEKMPLCYMPGFEEYSSDIRRSLFDEERMMMFLNSSAEKEKRDFYAEKNPGFFKPPQCSLCNLDDLCPGINPNYVSVHGSGECYPVFFDKNEIISRAQASRGKKTGSEDMDSDPDDDLDLFRKAIELKENKNNIYDTYSFFLTESQSIIDHEKVSSAWRAHRGNDIDLYIHTPFCASSCSYCIYPSTVPSSADDIQRYVDYLIGEMHRSSILFKGSVFRSLYLGGGTPSIYDLRQMESIFRSLAPFTFSPDAERTIEMNPGSTDKEKLSLIRRFGFNRISFGVQSLSGDVLVSNNRKGQTIESVKSAILGARGLSLDVVNADLVIGLKGDTHDSFIRSFRELCRIGPDTITIYPIKTNKEYIDAHYNDALAFERFYYPLFDSVYSTIFPVAIECGYSSVKQAKSYIAPIIFARDSWRPIAGRSTYSHFSAVPSSVLGLGLYSHSRIEGEMEYIIVDKDRPRSMFLKSFSTDPKDYCILASRCLPGYSKVKYIIQKIYHDREVGLDEYRTKFGAELQDDFRYAVDSLEKLRVITIRDRKMLMRLCDEKLLYPYLLFFAGRKNVEKRIIKPAAI